MSDEWPMCRGVRRVGRSTGTPCTCRASAIVNGLPYCGTHARLVGGSKFHCCDADRHLALSIDTGKRLLALAEAFEAALEQITEAGPEADLRRIARDALEAARATAG